LSKEEAIRCYLTPERLNAIYECISNALQMYDDDYTTLRFKHSPRTHASVIHDLMVDNIKKRFANDHKVNCFYKKGLFHLLVDNGDIVIRFKKLDRNLRTHNIPTQQSFNFTHQMSMFNPPATNLNAGYQTVGLKHRILITCPNSHKSNAWVLELSPATTATVIQMPHNVNIAAEQRRIPKKKGLEENRETQEE
jgi:hypothetical protein